MPKENALTDETRRVVARDELSRASRAAWNEAAPFHGKYFFRKLLKGFRSKDFTWMNRINQEGLLEHGIAGKAIGHLCCNNGRDVLSLKNLGAGRCVGLEQRSDCCHGIGK